jgi:hypothetical protein
LAHTDSDALTGIRRSIYIPASLRVFLGSERDAVIKVQSLLVCIGQAMASEHGAKGPYYPDVVGLAADILRQRVVNLDELLLNGVVPADWILPDSEGSSQLAVFLPASAWTRCSSRT